MTDSQRRWLTRLAKAVATAAVLTAVLAAAGKWWIVPAVVRWHLHRHLPEYWDGRASVADVDFSYSGIVPITLRGLSLRDRAGREWFRAESVHLVVPNWPSLSPKLGGLLLGRPEVTAHSAAGVCDVPIRKVPSELWDEYVALKSLLVQDGAVEAVADGEPPARSTATASLAADGRGDYVLRLASSRPLTVRELRADALVVADDRLVVRRLTGRTCGGRLAASVTARLSGKGQIEAQGQLAAGGVDLAELGLPIEGGRKGLATGIVTFQAVGLGAKGLTGHGAALVKGADLRSVPAVAGVLSQAGLGRLDAMSRSDVELQFQLRGTVVTFEQARIHLSLAAIDVEPGGTLDAWTGRLDAHVVVLLFQNVRGVLKQIPLVGLVMDLTEKFSRLRIRGKWQDRESLQIESAPLAGVTRGTRQFLTDAARGTGRFGKAILNGLGGAFGPADPNGTSKPGGP